MNPHHKNKLTAYSKLAGAHQKKFGVKVAARMLRRDDTKQIICGMELQHKQGHNVFIFMVK